MGHDAKVGILLLIWGAAVFSGITGVIFTPSFRANRRDNPKDFWFAYGVSCIFAVIATVFVVTQL